MSTLCLTPLPVPKTYISVPKTSAARSERLSFRSAELWVYFRVQVTLLIFRHLRWKKSGELGLCCDYSELNRKSVSDRHPIPRDQDTLDFLHGSSWFSVLEQGKAYHQGFLDPESHPDNLHHTLMQSFSRAWRTT